MGFKNCLRQSNCCQPDLVELPRKRRSSALQWLISTAHKLPAHQRFLKKKKIVSSLKQFFEIAEIINPDISMACLMPEAPWGRRKS